MVLSTFLNAIAPLAHTLQSPPPHFLVLLSLFKQISIPNIITRNHHCSKIMLWANSKYSRHLFRVCHKTTRLNSWLRMKSEATGRDNEHRSVQEAVCEQNKFLALFYDKEPSYEHRRGKPVNGKSKLNISELIPLLQASYIQLSQLLVSDRQ